MSRDDLPLLALPKHAKVLHGYIDGLLPGIYRVEFVRARNQRTLNQNSYLHGVVLPVIALGLSALWGYSVSPDEAKTTVKDMFLRRERFNPQTGELLDSYYTPSTADLSISEMCEFIDQCCEFATDKLGISVPSADEYDVTESETLLPTPGGTTHRRDL